MTSFTMPELALLGMLDFATAAQLQDLASLPGLSDHVRRRICKVSARRARAAADLGEMATWWDHHHLSNEFSAGVRTHPDLRIIDVGKLSPERRAWLRAELNRSANAGDLGKDGAE